MMKKNLKMIIVAVALLVVVSAAVFAVYAYLSSQAKAQNTFVPAQVSCKVNEEREDNKKTEVTVQNTSNVGAYIRVIVVTYWQDSRGGIVYRKSEDLELNSKFDDSKWIMGDDNTFYYKEIVEKDGETADLLQDDQSIVLDSESKTDDNGIVFEYYQVVEFIAEAIQAAPEEAVKNSWGVTITDGKITSVN